MSVLDTSTVNFASSVFHSMANATSDRTGFPERMVLVFLV
jgi:hypothetical protein